MAMDSGYRKKQAAWDAVSQAYTERAANRLARGVENISRCGTGTHFFTISTGLRPSFQWQ
jgi:hypothetical protein